MQSNIAYHPKNVCMRLLGLFVICVFLCGSLNASGQRGKKLKQTKPLTKDTQTAERPKAPTHTVETEDDSKTNIEIYFIDVFGVSYRTQQELEILDHSTGKRVMRLKRTVDTAGRPEPKKIAAGTYDVRLPGKTRFLASGIPILDKKKNKVTIKVKGGSLRFAYEGNPGRPVTEFAATVTRRFDNPQRYAEHKGTEELYYPPGNYYIEVNTVPITRCNADLEFNSETEVRIPEPGYVVFAHSTHIKNVSVYTPMGDEFERFASFDLPGDNNSQKFQLRPGTYEAHYTRDVPKAKEKVIRFVIKQNQTTEVELL